MEKHALKMCTNANIHLQSIRKIRRYLTMESCKVLVHSLVTSRLDYANILLCKAPDRVTARLGRVQRSAASLIYGIRRYQLISITAVLHELHWLPVVIRIQYKLLVTVFKAYHSGTPKYLADMIKKHSPVRKLRSSQNPNLLEEPKYTEKSLDRSLSVLRGYVFGTDFLLNSGGLVHWTHLRNILRHICFKNITTQNINFYEPFFSILCELYISYCML